MKRLIALSVMVWILLLGGLGLAQDGAAEVDDKIQFGLSIFEMLAPVITVLLGWLAVRINGLIKAKTKNETMAGMLARANDTIFSLAKEAQQTVVAGLKAARKADSPGGEEILESELAAVKQGVVNNFKKLWGMAGLMELGKILGLGDGMLDKWIGSRVEAAVHDLKRDPQPPTP